MSLREERLLLAHSRITDISIDIKGRSVCNRQRQNFSLRLVFQKYGIPKIN